MFGSLDNNEYLFWLYSSTPLSNNCYLCFFKLNWWLYKIVCSWFYHHFITLVFFNNNNRLYALFIFLMFCKTKHLSTDADSSTNTTLGLTMNTPKSILKKNKTNLFKRKNSKTSRNMPKLAILPSTRGL